MKKSSILNFDPESLIKKQEEEEKDQKIGINVVKRFIEFFLLSPLLIMLFWKFSISSMFNLKGIDYFQALCLNGVVKVLIRKVEDDEQL
jgi:hypothetical protein